MSMTNVTTNWSSGTRCDLFHTLASDCALHLQHHCRGTSMTADDDPSKCVFCSGGRLFRRIEEIRFQQWTDKGSVVCQVQIPVLVCQQCGCKLHEEIAEEIIEAAVREQYGKLP